MAKEYKKSGSSQAQNKAFNFVDHFRLIMNNQMLLDINKDPSDKVIEQMKLFTLADLQRMLASEWKVPKHQIKLRVCLTHGQYVALNLTGLKMQTFMNNLLDSQLAESGKPQNCPSTFLNLENQQPISQNYLPDFSIPFLARQSRILLSHFNENS